LSEQWLRKEVTWSTLTITGTFEGINLEFLGVGVGDTPFGLDRCVLESGDEMRLFDFMSLVY
jgi:hypothetical protein